MKIHLSPLHQSALLLLSLACLPAARAAIQPNLDNVYANSYTLTGGTQIIWNSASTETAFITAAYALDGQQTNYVTWTQNEPENRPLQLASTASWADGSVTWKFVAPAGFAFDGGSVSIQGMGIWGTCVIDLKAYSEYSNNGYGVGGYSAGTGTLYGSDTHSVGEWTWSNWIVSVPTGVTSFYVTAAAQADWHSVWANNLQASDVTFATVPEPGALSLLALGGLVGLRRRRG